MGNGSRPVNLERTRPAKQKGDQDDECRKHTDSLHTDSRRLQGTPCVDCRPHPRCVAEPSAPRSGTGARVLGRCCGTRARNGAKRAGLLCVPDLRSGRATGRNPTHDHGTGARSGSRRHAVRPVPAISRSSHRLRLLLSRTACRGQSHAEKKGRRRRPVPCHDRGNGSGRVRRLLRSAFRLPAAALAGLGSVLALLAGALAWVTALAVVTVAGAWAWVGWQSFRSRGPAGPSTLYVMGGATALTAVAVMWRDRASARPLRSWDDQCNGLLSQFRARPVIVEPDPAVIVCDSSLPCPGNDGDDGGRRMSTVPSGVWPATGSTSAAATSPVRASSRRRRPTTPVSACWPGISARATMARSPGGSQPRRSEQLRGQHLEPARPSSAMGLYIDERADGPQRQALQTVFSGQAGGWPATIAGMMEEFRGVEFVPIAFEVAKDLAFWQAEIPGRVLRPGRGAQRPDHAARTARADDQSPRLGGRPRPGRDLGQLGRSANRRLRLQVDGPKPLQQAHPVRLDRA